MPVPKEEFAAWFDWARAKFAATRPYPLIDETLPNFLLLNDAYNERTDNEATHEHLQSRLAHGQNEIAVRFVILNYYYGLLHFKSDLKEECVARLRHQFRSDLAFFVRLRLVEECAGADDISWEIVNACAVRDWSRAQALYMRLRSAEEIPPGTFHAAYGHFLFRATFGDYDPDDPDDDSETLSVWWSVPVVDRSPELDPESHLKDLMFELSTLSLGLAESLSPPTGRSDELLRDAKNELEKARDTQPPELRPGLRSALAKCYMARGDYRQAAAEYKLLADAFLDQLAWTGLPDMSKLQSRIWARVAAALDLAQEDSELRVFLEHWINLRPDELGPRERLAKLEDRCGNWQAAYRYLSEEQSMNPAHDQDWKATLFVELGARAVNEQRFAEIIRESTERNPELQGTVEGIIGHYWPTFRLLSPSARADFKNATRFLFDSTIGERLWEAAAILAGKSLESQLRATVFEPFGDAARRTAALPVRANTPGARPEPLVAFIQRGPGGLLTLGAMVNYLLSIVSPKEGVERALRDWVKARRPKLFAALVYGKLNANVGIGELRNRAAHGTISQAEAADLYRASRSRSWLDELTRDK